MKLSARARYGTRALLELAMNYDGGPVQLKEIAKRQGISLSYLEQLTGLVVAAGLVESHRGARGGLSLRRHPRDIKLSEIIRVLEGETTLVSCVSQPEACPRSGFCVTRDVWGELGSSMQKVLESTTLQDLAERQKRKPGFKQLTNTYEI